jgi:hypothetical protein
VGPRCVTTHEIITTLAAVLSIAYSQKVKKEELQGRTN